MKMLDATASVGHTGPAGRNFWILGSKERSTGAAVVLGTARKRKEAGVRGSLVPESIRVRNTGSIDGNATVLGALQPTPQS